MAAQAFDQSSSRRRNNRAHDVVCDSERDRPKRWSIRFGDLRLHDFAHHDFAKSFESKIMVGKIIKT